MHWLDCTMIALVGTAALFGAWSGLLMQVFRLVGFGLAAYAAVSLHTWADGRLRHWFMDEADANVSRSVAYGLVFLVVYSVIFFATRLLERGVEAAQLQFYNRLLGAVLGAVKMTLFLGAICFGLQHVPVQEAHQIINDSPVARVLAQGTTVLVNAIPERFKHNLFNGWQEVRDQVT
jgi:membrane protein required for colicin V production